MTCDNNDDFDILIIADNFSLEVFPTTHKKSWAFLELGPFTLLDFCLEWVLWFDSSNVFVVTTTFKTEEINKILNRWSSIYNNNLHVINYENCYNINDLLRRVESQRLLKNDFIFIENIATFCSTNLPDYLSAFKSRLRQNRNNILTLLYTTKGARDCPLLGIQNMTNKLMLYNSTNDGLIKIPKKLFVSGTLFRSDLSPCGIIFCAHSFVSHFTGNYDFQNFDRIIQDILSNEDLLGQIITIEVVQSISAFSANNYDSLLKAKNQLIERDCFPLTFENVLPSFKDFDRLTYDATRKIYIPFKKEYLMNNLKNSVFRKDSFISEKAIIEWCTFGNHLKIGANSKVTNCIFGSYVQIGDNCVIEDSIFENHVIVGNDCQIKRHCYIGNNVKITKSTILEVGSVLKNDPPPKDIQKFVGEAEASNWHILCDKVNDYYSWYLKRPHKNRHLSFWYLPNAANALKSRQRNDSVKSCSSTISKTSRRKSQQSNNEDYADCHDGYNEINHVTSAYQGNIKQFFDEVLETMSSLLNSENSESYCNEGHIYKMKIEINASRLTYNVTIEDSTKNIFLAFLNIPELTNKFPHMRQVFKAWKTLWENFYKDDVSKLQLLHALEEFAIIEEKFQKILPNFILFLYDDLEFLSEELILNWHKGLPENSHLRSINDLQKLINWLLQNDD